MSANPTQLEVRNLSNISHATNSRNVSPNPAVSSLPTEKNTADFKECTHHRSNLKDLCCQTCRPWHVDHSLLELQKENLTSFLGKGEKQAREAKRRHAEILTCIDSFVKYANEARKEMDNQYEFIRKELQILYDRAIAEFENLKQDQLQQLKKEALYMQKIGDNWKIVKERGTRLLEQVATVNFITNAKLLILSNGPVDLVKFPEIFLRHLKYQPPKVAPENFLKNLQEYLLGRFIDQSSEDGSFQSRTQSSSSFSGDSNSTNHTVGSCLSFIEKGRFSEPEGLDDELTSRALRSPESTIERVSEISCEQFKTTGCNLKSFFSAFYQGDTMWICGCRNRMLTNDTVLINVDLTDNNVLLKQKTGDSRIEIPTIMFSHENLIVFAKRGGKEIFTFNTQTHKLKQIARFSDLAIAAMCGTKEVYYIDSKSPGHIRVLNPSHPTHGIIPTGLKEVKDCGFDMCLITESTSFQTSTDFQADKPGHTIILSVSMPHASVRALNKSGSLWQLDCRSHPDQLGLDFNPRSVSAAASGDIFIADGETGIVR